MPQYKTVAGPVGIAIGKKGDPAEAVRQYADILNREAVGGWELLLPIQEITVTRGKGCLAALFSFIGIGSAVEQTKHDMLIFVKHTPTAASSRPPQNRPPSQIMRR
jgi:hypothetical protein